MEDRKFCVYQHIDKITKEVKYVGSGSKLRVKSRSDRTEEHLSNWDNLDFLIIRDGLTLLESRNIEQQVIDSLDFNCLYNILKTTAKPKNISYLYISKLLEFDRTSPTLLRWKVDRYSLKGYVHTPAGSVAGCVDNTTNYVRLKIDGIGFHGHRVIYSLFNKVDVPYNLVVDHIDGNRLNNEPENLRLTTFSRNNKNKKFSDNYNIQPMKNCNSIAVRWTDEHGKRMLKSFNFTKDIEHLGYEEAYKKCYDLCLKIRDQIETCLLNGEEYESILQAY